MKTFASVVAVATLILCAATGASAQASAPAPPFAATTLNLTAEGQAKIAPDMASLTLGAETVATTAAQAIRGNADKMARLVAAVRAAGVAARDLQTSSLALSPQYAEEPGRAPRGTGYQASNQLTVTVRDLTALGPIVDAAGAAGATNMGEIALGLANPLSAENSARIAAVKAVEDKAALYAQAVGYHIVRLVNLSEGEAYAPTGPRPMAMAAMRMAAPTPVEPGELTVRISVSAVFELAR